MPMPNPPCPPFFKGGNLLYAVSRRFLPFAKGGQEGFAGPPFMR